MTKKALTVIVIAAFALSYAQASEPASEVLVSTNLEPATVIDILDTPLPVPDDARFEVPAVEASQAYVVPRFPGFRPQLSTGKTLFDANLVVMVGLNVADYVSTRQALKYPGLAEANPIMKPFVKSPAAFAAVKLGTTVLTYWSFKALFKRNRTMAWIMSTATNCLLSYVVANNFSQIQRARRAAL